MEVLKSLKESEWKVLWIFYGSGDKHAFFYANEIARKLRVPVHSANYHIKKLVQLGLIEEIRTYPKFWEPVKDKATVLAICSSFTDYMRQKFGGLGK